MRGTAEIQGVTAVRRTRMRDGGRLLDLFQALLNALFRWWLRFGGRLACARRTVLLTSLAEAEESAGG